ncbi:hypothetical protein COO60DRAFT_715890 [Scenedesmus sp. NREL 46B-D3]|nr:hypothetical protein COO60DRAFT_715890 [Scenedesmus sp. NREL 46B-D3]
MRHLQLTLRRCCCFPSTPRFPHHPKKSRSQQAHGPSSTQRARLCTVDALCTTDTATQRSDRLCASCRYQVDEQQEDAKKGWQGSAVLLRKGCEAMCAAVTLVRYPPPCTTATANQTSMRQQLSRHSQALGRHAQAQCITRMAHCTPLVGWHAAASNLPSNLAKFGESPAGQSGANAVKPASACTHTASRGTLVQLHATTQWERSPHVRPTPTAKEVQSECYEREARLPTTCCASSASSGVTKSVRNAAAPRPQPAYTLAQSQTRHTNTHSHKCC